MHDEVQQHTEEHSSAVAVKIEVVPLEGAVEDELGTGGDRRPLQPNFTRGRRRFFCARVRRNV